MTAFEPPGPVIDLPPYGPPYAPRVALLGLIPTVRVDVPICAVLIAVFLAAAALNLNTFVSNNARGHNFPASAALVGFCTIRVIALSLRIAWAAHPDNIKIEIAANVFAAAGVVLLFSLNLVLVLRLLRALHPNIGWNPLASSSFLLLHALVAICLICALTVTIISFYTLSPGPLLKCRIVQLFSSTTLALLASLPVPLLLAAAFYPGKRRPEPFGHGSISTKLLLVLATALLLTIGAAYRCAVNYAARPAWAPAWWHHKACYYIFNYDLELVVVFTYALMRFDIRFHVPDGACKPGDYIKGQHAYTRVSSLAVAGFHRRCRRCGHGHGHGHDGCGCGCGCDDVEVREVSSTYYRRGGGSRAISTNSSSSSRSVVIRGLSEIDRASRTSSVSDEIVVEEQRDWWERRSRGRLTRQTRSSTTRGSGHHHHHHHHHHHNRRRHHNHHHSQDGYHHHHHHHRRRHSRHHSRQHSRRTITYV